VDPRQAPLGQHPSERDTTAIYCIDYDGCFDAYAIWCNPALTEMLKAHGLTQEKWLHYVLENSPIGQSILEAAKNPKTKRLVFVSISNRQNLILDVTNRMNNFDEKDHFENGSVFAFIPKWTEAVRDFLKDNGITEVAVEYCEHTLHDIWYENEAGTEYRRCETPNYPLAFTNKLEDLDKALDKLHETGDYYNPLNPAVSAPYFDHSKISTTYALCHAFEEQYPGKKMVRIYDDRPEICLSIYQAFTEHATLLPESIALQVYHHDTYSPSFNPKEIASKKPATIMNLCLTHKSSNPTLHAMEEKENKLHFVPIQGEGPYDAQYKQNVRELHHILSTANLTEPGWKLLLKHYPMQFNKTRSTTSDGPALVFPLTLSRKHFDELFGKKGTLEIILNTFMKAAALSHSRSSTPSRPPSSAR
jgi:hypothetical protein